MEVLDVSPQSIPKRRRRYVFPTVVACILVRWELLIFASLHRPCTSTGIQPYLCVLLALHDAWARMRTKPILPEPIDPWSSVSDEIRRLTSGVGGTVVNVVMVVLCCRGLSLAGSQATASTIYCSKITESPGLVHAAQWLGLLIDFVVVLLIWHMLSWARTTRARINALGSLALLVVAGWVVMMVMWRIILPSHSWSSRTSAQWASIHALDFLVDGALVLIPAMAISLAAWSTQPLATAMTLTSVLGAINSMQNIVGLGSWEHLKKADSIAPLYSICIPFSIFLYTSDTKTVAFIRRIFVLLVPLGLLIAGTIITTLRDPKIDRHPIRKLVYDARVNHDRWLRHASFSMRLETAVAEYKKRNFGRDPPEQFGVWYEFAKEKDSVIVDHFDQISRDMLPYWGIEPGEIHTGIEMALKEPGVAFVEIRNKEMRYGGAVRAEDQKTMDDLVRMVNKFARHLPDMVIPLNLEYHPRTIPSFSKRSKWKQQGRRKSETLLGKRSVEKGDIAEKVEDARFDKTAATSSLRSAIANACPSMSGFGSGHNRRELCSHCMSRHSEGQFLADFSRSLDVCRQPDLLDLHGYHLAASTALHRRIDLPMPMFSRVKTDYSADILIPILDTEDEVKDDWKEFTSRRQRLFYRAMVNQKLEWLDHLRGGHKYRLVHAVNNATAEDEVTLLLPDPNPDKKRKYRYEKTSLAQANTMLPFDVGMSRWSYLNCADPATCATAEKELGYKQSEETYNYRYILHLDEDTGMSRGLLRALRSNSVPFVGTVFRQWYTERLMPWLHFVPVDLRFQGLHSTAAYFFGLDGVVNGREVKMDGKVDDGRWIADEGRKWARKAMRDEDREVYLFRLLMEWGRVISPERDRLRFKGQ